MIEIKENRFLYNLWRVCKWTAVSFALWMILSFFGIFAVIALMYLTKDNPAYGLEMGWMAILIFVPVVAALLSLVLTLFIFKRVRKKKHQRKVGDERKTL